MKKDAVRVETDSMGEMKVPAGAYYGAQTERARQNFPISGRRMPREFLRAIGLIKGCAAQVNVDLKLLDKKLAAAIGQAAAEVAEGKLDEHFPLDVYQTGSGTSTNMNANEVIANRAIEILGGKIGSKTPVHPNDHVNKGQSSNDVIPTAIYVAAREAMETRLVPALERLHQALDAKARAFDGVVKIGRTHLQDATPVRLGQEFSGYARQVELGVARARRGSNALAELALGGTAVGTGLNAPEGFAARVIALVSERTGVSFKEAANHFEAQANLDGAVEASGALRSIAVSLSKVADDIRWLASGPRCGLGEISIPAVQPGSSIMPGKVNPVIAESLIQACAQVIAGDLAVALGGLGGHFELNLMMPLVGANLIDSVGLLAAAARNFAIRCVEGIEADRERCQDLVERSLMLVTAIAPKVGYDTAAKLAKEAHATRRTIRELLRERKLLPEDEIDRVLDPTGMTYPGLRAGGGGE